MWNCMIEVFTAMYELDPNDKLVWEKVPALLQVDVIIRRYAKEGFPERLLRPIAEKKVAFIKDAKTKTALSEILKPPKPRYDGNKVQCFGEYHIPEEELLIWSLTSLLAPLNDMGANRMFELMKQVYLEHESLLKSIGIN